MPNGKTVKTISHYKLAWIRSTNDTALNIDIKDLEKNTSPTSVKTIFYCSEKQEYIYLNNLQNTDHWYENTRST